MDEQTNQSKKSLKISFIEGAFASAMVGFTQEYFTPFLLLLGATVRHVGFLSALPNFFASLVQLKSADITERLKSRKKLICIFVFLQAVVLLPMAMVALSRKAHPFIFIGLVILYTSFGAFAIPPWGSLMSDLVEKEKRGDYFGWRNRMLGFVTVGSAFLAGLILHQMKKINIYHGFFILFLSASIWRIISWYFLGKMYEPLLNHKKEDHFTLIQFWRRLKESNFAKFVLFVSLMSFSVNICSPFFAVLMLRDLKFSYLQFSIITITATLTIFLAMRRWGRLADRVGNLRIIKFVSPLIGLIPLLWVINRHPFFLILAQVFSGFLWAGFNLCTSNFIYDAVTPEKRTRCISYFNVFNGLALSSGALLGGFLLPKLPELFGYKILSLLIISSVCRILVGIFMPIKLKEVRPVENISSNELFFSMIGVKALLGVDRKTIRY